ncbi:MAG: ECF transporter S component [Christensenellales bacterium]
MANKTRKIVLAGIFSAIVLILGLTPIGIIPIGPANFTITHIPVIILTLTNGLGMGMVAGAMFGLASTIRSFTTPSTLVAPMIASGWLGIVFVIIMAFLGRIMIAVTTHYIYKLISKDGTKNKVVGMGVAALCGTLTNTILYLGCMLLFYILLGIDSAVVIGVIASVAVLNGPVEAIAAMLICPPVVLAVQKAYGHTGLLKE